MKKNILRLLSTLFLLFCNVFLYGEDPVPPSPYARPGDGDTGTPGAPASPIDMYIPLLIILAVLFIVWYVRKRRIQIQ